ncbi:hypothetical protein AMATHDRAFT_61668 [Amanita thiersii Skay4041]|uniref:GRAM domain-containing protein n=1 Tax=Amanita thiersii Skay4041 TaxID=703135 RepID=A0A2A9NR66_9AGAR|nr:hypothetical protein AMATHDRAFT_61668 [Amanita thiersii Skay4041]
MALNWTMLTPDRTPVPLPNEMTITSIDSGVDLTLTIPDVPPSGSSSTSGGSGGVKRHKAVGKIWLTDQRLVFTAPSNSTFDSLSVPLHSILSTRYEQPTFGANNLTFDIRPSPGGDLTEGTTAVVRFKDRAMFEFVSLLEKTRERAIYMKRQMEEDEEGLPSYTTPAESNSVTMIGAVPVENPPSYDS